MDGKIAQIIADTLRANSISAYKSVEGNVVYYDGARKFCITATEMEKQHD